jgi:competence protein ComEA
MKMGGAMGSAISRLLRLGLLPVLALITLTLDGHAQGLPDGAGKEAVQQACGRCHGLQSVSVARHTRQEWDNVVTDMIGRGASIMESEIPAIVEYLARSFPKGTVNINVNRATARELVDSLRLTAEEAEALVRYRDENGYFNKFQDLEKVAGLDLKKLDPAKDRLQY